MSTDPSPTPAADTGPGDATPVSEGEPSRAPRASACEPFRDLIVDAVGRGRLQGERLSPAGYVRQPVATALDGTLALRSEVLGLELRAAPGREMRFRDPATGDDLRRHDEDAECRLAEVRRREAEVEGRLAEAVARWEAESRAAAAESRAAELEARLRRRSDGAR